MPAAIICACHPTLVCCFVLHFAHDDHLLPLPWLSLPFILLLSLQMLLLLLFVLCLCCAHTEALLHQFLGQRPGAAPPTLGSAHFDSTFSPASSTVAATSAAQRRAADLLAITADARRARTAGAGAKLGASGAGDSTLALCRKQYYAGVVSGLSSLQCEVTTPEGPARKLFEALDGAARNFHSLAVLEERYLAAAALLAISQAGVAGSAAGDGSDEDEEETYAGPGGSACTPRAPEAYALLQSLCAVPLARSVVGAGCVSVCFNSVWPQVVGGWVCVLVLAGSVLGQCVVWARNMVWGEAVGGMMVHSKSCLGCLMHMVNTTACIIYQPFTPCTHPLLFPPSAIPS